MTSLQALVVAGFVLVHVFAGKLRLLARIPRSSWLSTAGGISVAYVFIHVFPELARAQGRMGEGWRMVPFLEYHAYFVALCGLVFYGLEGMVKSSHPRGRRRESGGEGETTSRPSVFWVHISSFAVYKVLIGYLLCL